MARTAITVNAVAENTAAAPTATSIDATNSHVITDAKNVSKILLRINNTTASTKTITVKAGDNPPAVAAGQGDLTISLTQDQTKAVVLESGRFLQDDGTVNIDVAASMTGTIEAYLMPKGH